MSPFREYLTESQALSPISTPNWGIQLLDMGYNLHPARKSYPDNAHPAQYAFKWSEGRILNEYQLIYISNGKGIFESEQTGALTVTPGTAILLVPGTWHRYQPSYETGWEEFWIGFKGDYPDYLKKTSTFDEKKPLVQVGFETEISTIFERLFKTLQVNTNSSYSVLSCYTIQLLGIVYGAALERETCKTRKETIIDNLKFDIHQHWSDNLQMDELAKQHQVSYNWFRKAFKELNGIAPGQYHLNLKIQKACEMLNESDLNISEIAYKAGFLTEFHFSKIFKKKMVVSPTTYRRRSKDILLS